MPPPLKRAHRGLSAHHPENGPLTADPEASYTGQSSIGQVDLFTLPLPRTLSVRLNVDW